MKKTIQIIAVATLCFFLSIAARGQTTSLKIGDRVPDITINHVLKYKNSSLKLSDFKGKLLILDFYATWCAPCITMIPRMDSLQKQFAGKVQFLSITSQKASEVKTFKERLEKQKNTRYNLAEIVEDKVLHGLFPHSSLPHYVWIDQNGFIRAITESIEVNEQNIQKFLDQGNIAVRVKKDTLIAFNRNKPFLIGNNGGDGSKLVYHSVLTDYIPGLGVGLKIWRDSTGMKIMARNLCLAELYRLSFRENGRYLSLRKAELNVKDPSRLIVWKFGKEYEDWLQDKNGYSYELIVPPSLTSQAYSMMQQDLKRLFPAYRASVEKRNTLSLVLVNTSGSRSYKTKGSKPGIRFDPFGCSLVNVPIAVFLNRLKMQYMPGKYPEILNETGYNGNVDLTIKASLSDLNGLNRELEKYQLQFVEGERSIETLVIRDREDTEGKFSGQSEQ
ncbi:MAG: TlpA family protein disulfide reductase [Daejeonella sp.]